MAQRFQTAKPHRMLYGLILSALILHILIPALRALMPDAAEQPSGLDFTRVDHPRSDGKQPPRAPARKPLRFLPAVPGPDGLDCRGAGLVPTDGPVSPPVLVLAGWTVSEGAMPAATGIRLSPLRRAPPAA